MPLIKFGIKWKEMSIEEFHGGHLGYWIGTILAMPPTKFQINPTYGSGEDVKNVKSHDGRQTDRP